MNTDGKLSFRLEINSPDGLPGDYFGRAVTVFNNWMAVGASERTETQNNQGAVYIYKREVESSVEKKEYYGTESTNWKYHSKIVASDAAANDYFGGAVAMWGNRLFIGANGQTSSRGKVYLFLLSGNSWTESTTYTHPTPADNNKFGRSLAIYNNILAVGASGVTINGFSSGAAYLYEIQSDNTLSTPKEYFPITSKGVIDGENGEGFGHAIELNQRQLIIGSPFKNRYRKSNQTTYTDVGRTFYYTRIEDTIHATIHDYYWPSIWTSNGAAVKSGESVKASNKLLTVKRSIAIGPSSLSKKNWTFLKNNKTIGNANFLFRNVPNYRPLSNLNASIYAIDGNDLYYGTSSHDNSTGILHIFRLQLSKVYVPKKDNSIKELITLLESLPSPEKNNTTLQSLILRYQNSREALIEIEKAFGVSIVG